MKSIASALLTFLTVASALAQSYAPSGAPAPAVDPHSAIEEHISGRTAAGNPVEKRGVDDFPAERRDVFAPMDQRAGDGDHLVPLTLSPDEIRGRNTWVLWCAGNETFWSWLQQYGYGFADFLKVVDSRERAGRFHKTGLINQPGMGPRENGKTGPWGLRLDEVKTLLPNTDGKDYHGQPIKVLDDGQGNQLRSDGVNPDVYGYPSGVVGIRLFPNPDFNDEAKKRWDANRYYNDKDYYLDPKLVRPLRVGMSCGVCHVGPHPMNPPADPENPGWENLSTTIGAQYLKTQEVFGNLLGPDNLIYHYLRSQQPGTIDTSLTATDHINNANTMTGIWDLPSRLRRAQLNVPEHQSAANLLIPTVEDATKETNPRHTPRILVDGSDSVGAFGALARVYLNIGTYYEEWNRVQNPIVGIRHQKPFSVAAAQANSVFWQVNEKYRAGYLKAFFTQPQATSPMRLADVARASPEPHRSVARAALARGPHEQVARGRAVYVKNCMICHSSKQPEGYDLAFADKLASSWDTAPYDADKPWPLTLPRQFANWEAFKRSPSYQAYLTKAYKLAGDAPAAGQEDAFLKDNFMANEVRIPVTLVGTSSARAVGTNAMAGHVWDNFSSEDYKHLPAVGSVRIYNPYGGGPSDPGAFGLNDDYAPPAGGPGYYRPATLISLWATGPYLHNNALGPFFNEQRPANQDPATFVNETSVQRRLEVFEDGIAKLLWNSRRHATPSGVLTEKKGEAWTPEAWTQHDPAGWIYRTTQRTVAEFPAKFIRELIASVVGSRTLVVAEVAIYLVALLLVVIGLLTPEKFKAHVPGLVVLLLGGAVAYFLYGMEMAAVMPFPAWLLPAGLFIFAAILIRWLKSPGIARIIHFGTALLLVTAGVLLHLFLDGTLGNLRVGPFPKGTPISLILNLNPDSPASVRFEAIAATFKGMRAIDKITDEDEALKTFEKIAGPALVRASKCPDYVMDRGHWFGEALTDAEKYDLIAFLRTL